MSIQPSLHESPSERVDVTLLTLHTEQNMSGKEDDHVTSAWGNGKYHKYPLDGSSGQVAGCR